MNPSIEQLQDEYDDAFIARRSSEAPKPSPHAQNWQVQELNGTPVEGGDFLTQDAARTAAIEFRNTLQRPVRVRRTA